MVSDECKTENVVLQENGIIRNSNGEIIGRMGEDIIDYELKGLCDRYFLDVMRQPYAGASKECMYCGAMELKDKVADHSYTDCPVIKYKEILVKRDS